jgi:hypothetical protein
VPGGNFNCEFYFSVNSNNHDPFIYAELYKYDGTTFTLLGSSQAIPEYLTSGTNLNPYYFAIPVATASLTLTDRIAIRIYVNVDTRIVTLHTEDNHLCQVVTTFSKGMTSLNNLTKQVQYLTTGTSGTNFAIVSSNDTHTFNLPTASATNTGKLSSSDWGNFNTAYNDTIVSASVSGTTTKTLTLTQQDAGTITASWTDLNTDAVSSVFGRTGAVVAANGDYTTTQVTEGTNLYYTEARVNANTNVAANTAARHAAVTIGTANGLSLSTQALSLAAASTSATGALTSTDWNTFNGKQAALNGTGFVKISGTTISYDNSTYLTTSSASSTYLPLAGGTLTGALTGTSATFSGKVLINTITDVQGALQVNTNGGGLLVNADNSNFAILFRNTSSSNKLWDFSSFNNDFTINEGGVATRMYFKAGGNIGIGTTTPSATLSVVGNATFSSSVQSSSLIVAGSGYFPAKLITLGGAEFSRYNANIGTNIVNGSQIGLSFGTRSNNVDYDNTLNLLNGNVGIGTSSPAMSLQIGNGTSTGNQYLRLFNSASDMYIGQTASNLFGAGNGQVIVTDGTYTSNFAIGTLNASANLIFGTDNTERMRITSGGWFKASNNGSYISTTQASHELYSSQNSNYGVIFSQASSIPYGLSIRYTTVSPNITGDNQFLACSDTTNEKLIIWSSGTVVNRTGVYGTISDETLKENIVNTTPKLDKLLQLKVRNFNFIGEDLKQLGFVAQEMEEVFPNMVDKDKEGLKSVKTTVLIPMLVKAIQELETRIKQLENK